MFQPRSYVEILTDMLNYVQTHTDLTDFEIGSAIRTILEAAALEDDEQYFQMVQLLDDFDIRNARGPGLIRRVADDDVVPLLEGAASGKIIVRDGNLITDTLEFDAASTSTSIVLTDITGFPTSGFPYAIRVGESTTSVEETTAVAIITSTSTIIVSPALTNNHSRGDRVSYVSGASDVSLAPGIQAQIRAKNGNPAFKYVTTEKGVIVNGNFNSTPIRAKALLPGTAGNSGVGEISEFASALPFDGALVTNEIGFAGGREKETDIELINRTLSKRQSLSRGIKLAVKQAALGVVDPVTSQRVTSSSIVEDQVNDEVILYIDDGTGFIADQTNLPETSLTASTIVSQTTLPLVSTGSDDFPAEGYVIVSPTSGNIELVRYFSVNYATDTLNLATPLASPHTAGDEVVIVDVLVQNSEPGVTFLRALKFPIVRGSQRLWMDSGAGFQLQTLGTDYFLNKGIGEIQLTSGLAEDSDVVITYSYNTGLAFQVQRVVTGDRSDEISYPGVAAAGIKVIVEAPSIRRVTIKVAITIKGIGDQDTEDEVAPLVQEAIENYMNTLGVGDDVIRSEIIAAAMNVPGVFNAIVSAPTGDVVVLENELAVPFGPNGNSLVSVV